MTDLCLVKKLIWDKMVIGFLWCVAMVTLLTGCVVIFRLLSRPLRKSRNPFWAEMLPNFKFKFYLSRLVSLAEISHREANYDLTTFCSLGANSYKICQQLEWWDNCSLVINNQILVHVVNILQALMFPLFLVIFSWLFQGNLCFVQTCDKTSTLLR